MLQSQWIGCESNTRFLVLETRTTYQLSYQPETDLKGIEPLIGGLKVHCLCLLATSPIISLTYMLYLYHYNLIGDFRKFIVRNASVRVRTCDSRLTVLRVTNYTTNANYKFPDLYIMNIVSGTYIQSFYAGEGN